MIDLIIQWNCVHIATWGSTKKRRNTCRYTRLLSTKSYQLDSNQPLWLPQLFLWFKISSDLGIAQPNFEFSICNGTLSKNIQNGSFRKEQKVALPFLPLQYETDGGRRQSWASQCSQDLGSQSFTNYIQRWVPCPLNFAFHIAQSLWFKYREKVEGKVSYMWAEAWFCITQNKNCCWNITDRRKKMVHLISHFVLRKFLAKASLAESFLLNCELCKLQLNFLVATTLSWSAAGSKANFV